MARKPGLDDHVPFRERLLCTPMQAAAALGRSRATIWRLIAAGHLETTTIEGCETLAVRVASVLRLAGE